MKITPHSSEDSHPIDSNNYNVVSTKNHLKQTLHHFITGLDSLIHNPDLINQQTLQDLAESIKELKKHTDIANKAPTNSAPGQTLIDASIIINNTLEAPIDT